MSSQRVIQAEAEIHMPTIKGVRKYGISMILDLDAITIKSSLRSKQRPYKLKISTVITLSYIYHNSLDQCTQDGGKDSYRL